MDEIFVTGGEGRNHYQVGAWGYVHRLKLLCFRKAREKYVWSLQDAGSEFPIAGIDIRSGYYEYTCQVLALSDISICWIDAQPSLHSLMHAQSLSSHITPTRLIGLPFSTQIDAGRRTWLPSRQPRARFSSQLTAHSTCFLPDPPTWARNFCYGEPISTNMTALRNFAPCLEPGTYPKSLANSCAVTPSSMLG